MRRANERELGSWRATAKLLPLEDKPQRLTPVSAIQNAADKPTIESLPMPPWKVIQTIVPKNSFGKKCLCIESANAIEIVRPNFTGGEFVWLSTLQLFDDW
jgi:hypothetical protein